MSDMKSLAASAFRSHLASIEEANRDLVDLRSSGVADEATTAEILWVRVALTALRREARKSALAMAGT